MKSEITLFEEEAQESDELFAKTKKKNEALEYRVKEIAKENLEIKNRIDKKSKQLAELKEKSENFLKKCGKIESF